MSTSGAPQIERYADRVLVTGHIATHKQDLTPEQIAKGAEEFFANMGGCDH